MEKFLIKGPSQLEGTVTISGSKNAALPLLFASIATGHQTILTNVPDLWDVSTSLKLLNTLGATTERDFDKKSVFIDTSSLSSCEAPYEIMKTMRAGVLCLGPLLGRFKQAKVSLPGGCSIGARPIDVHIAALKQMGANIEINQGDIQASCPEGLKGTDYTFPVVSVTGTENIMMAACFASGKTILRNCALEPEITTLGRFLNQSGAQIQGLGTTTLEITPTKFSYQPQKYATPSDRIEAGTWVCAAAATQSTLTLEKFPFEDLEFFLDTCRKMNLTFEENKKTRALTVKTHRGLKPAEVVTEVYPGFPTDLQAQLMALCALIPNGYSQITETIFENRFMHIAELRRLGAQIRTEKNKAFIQGGAPLKGAQVMATDLRASASLVIAALCAEGETTLDRIYHLDRGYEQFDAKLNNVGAQVQRIDT